MTRNDLTKYLQNVINMKTVISGKQNLSWIVVYTVYTGKYMYMYLGREYMRESCSKITSGEWKLTSRITVHEKTITVFTPHKQITMS